MKLYKIFVMSIASLSIAGCANFNSIHRDLKVDSGEGVLIDVKQRAILVSKRIPSTGVTPAISQTIVCAEPSPDALSAYAAELALQGNGSKGVGGALSGSTQEAAAFIGLRTQSIQLLRDLMYRNCEAYLNNAITSDDYALLMRRTQKYMVALLAIEQITGAIKSPAVTLTTSGFTSATETLKNLETKKKQLTDDNAKMANDVTDPKTTAEQKAAINKEIKANESQISDLDKAIASVGGLQTQGSSAGAVYVETGANRPTGADLASITTSIKEIVMDITDQDDAGALCWSYWKANKPIAGLKTYCDKWLTIESDKLDKKVKGPIIQSNN